MTTTIQEAEARRHAASGAIQVAQVAPYAPDATATGYRVQLGLRSGDGTQPVTIGSAREPVRRFASIDSAAKWLRANAPGVEVRVV